MSIPAAMPRNCKQIFELIRDAFARWPYNIDIQESACRLLAFTFHICTECRFSHYLLAGVESEQHQYELNGWHSLRPLPRLTMPVIINDRHLVSQRPVLSTKNMYAMAVVAAKAHPDNAVIQDSCCDVFNEMLYTRTSSPPRARQTCAKKQKVLLFLCFFHFSFASSHAIPSLPDSPPLTWHVSNRSASSIHRHS